MDALLKVQLERVIEAINAIPETRTMGWEADDQEKIANAIHYVDALRSNLRAYTPKRDSKSIGSGLTPEEKAEWFKATQPTIHKLIPVPHDDIPTSTTSMRTDKQIRDRATSKF
jgi:hypothetical protein